MLEHGLLLGAQGLDDLRIVSKKTTGADVEEDDEPTENYEAFEARVNAYVAIHLHQASGSKRDHYKDNLVYQARRELIQDFLKTTITKKCQNPGCGA